MSTMNARNAPKVWRSGNCLKRSSNARVTANTAEGNAPKTHSILNWCKAAQFCKKGACSKNSDRALKIHFGFSVPRSMIISVSTPVIYISIHRHANQIYDVLIMCCVSSDPLAKFWARTISSREFSIKKIKRFVNDSINTFPCQRLGQHVCFSPSRRVVTSTWWEGLVLPMIPRAMPAGA
jgi:hypothetical protein